MTKKPELELIFVYNAESGLANSLIDYGKKYVAPSTYDCQLCMVSYGPFGMKKDWKKFVASLPYPASFLHKDECKKKFPQYKGALPALLLVGTDTISTLLSAQDFEGVRSLDELKAKVSSSLQ